MQRLESRPEFGWDCSTSLSRCNSASCRSSKLPAATPVLTTAAFSSRTRVWITNIMSRRCRRQLRLRTARRLLQTHSRDSRCSVHLECTLSCPLYRQLPRFAPSAAQEHAVRIFVPRIRDISNALGVIIAWHDDCSRFEQSMMTAAAKQPIAGDCSANAG